MRPAGPANQGTERYVFDGFVVDVGAHTLTRDGEAIALEPKAFAVLTALLRRPGELLGRDDLLDGVWGHRHVTPGVLTRAIAQLRSALGDDPQQPRYIQTQHALGYRFVGQLLEEQAAASSATDSAQAEVGEPAPSVAADAGENSATSAAPVPAASAPVDDLPSAVEHTPEPAPLHASPRQWWLASLLLATSLGAMWVWGERFARKPGPTGASIAVLPFSSISSDPGSAYFAEGLAVEMHDALAGVEGLTLAAQMSPDDPRRDEDIKALGAALGVANVLKASVRREGSKVRISAQLSDTSTGYSVWNKTYERELSDVFATQTEIATEVVESLVGILPAQREALANRLQPTTDLAAFDFYLQGLAALRRGADNDKGAGAIALFNKALAGDSGFALAQAKICRLEVSNFRDREDAGAFALAQASCERAREMDSSLGEVNLALAELHQAAGQNKEAAAYFAKAEEHPASRPYAFVGIGNMLAELGQDADAMQYFKRALALQPGNPRIHSRMGYRHYLAGRMPEAIASYRKAVELTPEDKLLWSYLGGVYIAAGRIPEAESALLRSLSIGPTYSALTNLGEIKYLSGNFVEAIDLQQRAVEINPSDHLTWGNLGQAQLANEATSKHANASFSEAAKRAQQYLQINGNDARALAALGWYLANLGQPEEALDLIAHAESSGAEAGEVALLNAQTLVVLGEARKARQRIASARAEGIVEVRITGNAVLKDVLTDADEVRAKKAP